MYFKLMNKKLITNNKQIFLDLEHNNFAIVNYYIYVFLILLINLLVLKLINKFSTKECKNSNFLISKIDELNKIKQTLNSKDDFSKKSKIEREIIKLNKQFSNSIIEEKTQKIRFNNLNLSKILMYLNKVIYYLFNAYLLYKFKNNYIYISNNKFFNFFYYYLNNNINNNENYICLNLLIASISINFVIYKFKSLIFR